VLLVVPFQCQRNLLAYEANGFLSVVMRNEQRQYSLFIHRVPTCCSSSYDMVQFGLPSAMGEDEVVAFMDQGEDAVMTVGEPEWFYCCMVRTQSTSRSSGGVG
jgi:hypothetical protein